MASEQTQTQWQGRDREGEDGLEDQSALHVRRRACALAIVLQRIHDHDKDASQYLPAAPAQAAPQFRAERVMRLDEELEHDGDEAETRRSQNRAYHVDVGYRMRLRGPDDDQVPYGQERDGASNVGQIKLVPVDDGRGNGGAHKADDNKNGACDARVRLAEPVRLEDLVQQTGKGVEKPHVHYERDEHEVEFDAADQHPQVVRQGRAVHVVRRAARRWRRGWFRGDEERGHARHGRDDADVQNHVGDVGRLVGPEGRDELA